MFFILSLQYFSIDIFRKKVFRILNFQPRHCYKKYSYKNVSEKNVYPYYFEKISANLSLIFLKMLFLSNKKWVTHPPEARAFERTHSNQTVITARFDPAAPNVSFFKLSLLALSTAHHHVKQQMNSAGSIAHSF